MDYEGRPARRLASPSAVLWKISRENAGRRPPDPHFGARSPAGLRVTWYFLICSRYARPRDGGGAGPSIGRRPLLSAVLDPPRHARDDGAAAQQPRARESQTGDRPPRRPPISPRVGALLGSCLVAASPGPADDGPAKPFRACAAAVDVTPPRFPISMNGQMADQVARSASDRLHGRCLVLDDGETEVAIVVVDSCMIPRPLFDEAKASASESTGIPADRMMMSATHTHTAPAVMGVFQTEPDADYVAVPSGEDRRGRGAGPRRADPGTIGWAVGRDASQVFCRRWLMKPGTAQTNPFGGTRDDRVQMHPGYQNPNAIAPTGPVDPDLSLLAVRATDGPPIALLANYGMHYAGYGIPPGAVSADYFGRFAAKVEAAAGPGAGGDPVRRDPVERPVRRHDTHCYDYSRPRKEVTIETVSDSVAKVALEAFRTIEFRDRVLLRMAERRLRVGLRLPDAAEVARAREVLDRAKGRPLKGLEEIYARETVLLGEGPRDAELVLQALGVGGLGVGGLGIGAIPNEVYAETGFEIKRRNPLRPTFVIELANGAMGYIPPPEQHALSGYTTWRARTSCLEVGAEPKVRDAVIRLLQEVAR